jgi:hypothetical protein
VLSDRPAKEKLYMCGGTAKATGAARIHRRSQTIGDISYVAIGGEDC